MRFKNAYVDLVYCRSLPNIVKSNEYSYQTKQNKNVEFQNQAVSFKIL